MEVGGLFTRLNDLLRQLHAAVAALAEHVGEREIGAVLLAVAFDIGELRLGVGAKAVDRHDDRHAVFAHVFNVYAEVDNALLKRLKVLLRDLRLGHAAVVFQGAAGGDQHDGGRTQTGKAALDVEEFFRTQIGAEACLGDAVVSQLER